MKNLACLSLLLSLFLIDNVFAKNIVIVIEDNAPPYSDSLGKGISYNLIKAIFKNSKYNVNLQKVPYARAVQLLKHDKVDGALHVTKEVQYRDLFYFSDEVFMTLNAHMYYNLKSKASYKTLAEVPNDTNIGVTIDFEYGKEFSENKKRFKLNKVSSQEQLIGLLQNNRINFALMYEGVAQHTLKRMKLPKNFIRKGELVTQSDAYLAFNKNRKHIKELAKFYDKRLRELKDNGEYQKILEE